MDIKSSAIAVVAIAVVLGSFLSYADEHEWRLSAEAVTPVNNETYAAECGSCHFAYPPGLLPARSWRALMGGLDNHFGDNAELAPDLVVQLTDYAVTNAADRSSAWVSRGIAATVREGQTPLRISELHYIRDKHDELPARLVRDNPEVAGLGNCSACHSGAKDGVFDEHSVRIPGYGAWED